ncbi:hypothetical protein L1987_80824 [Smallanthus sonchifolius]|uniref:Uncharacterized protein n=1 Tax=Smallanthus sonchifolius TaxID=185202 RepID=A0ACB8YNY1_9ASTR|nr:hypothetical protein L1987_80824 [Smallanthus sonchifolius]
MGRCWSFMNQTSIPQFFPLNSSSLISMLHGIATASVCLLRFVDAVLTVPKGTLFPMCGMNLAFDRDLIGPAMYFGLMGNVQLIGRYDDMWAGWCMKVTCDHLGLGVKTSLYFAGFPTTDSEFPKKRRFHVCVPPFESTEILEEKEIICVKRKGGSTPDACNLLDDVLEPGDDGLLLIANGNSNKGTKEYQSESEEVDEEQSQDELPEETISKKRKASTSLLNVNFSFNTKELASRCSAFCSEGSYHAVYNIGSFGKSHHQRGGRLIVRAESVSFAVRPSSVWNEIYFYFLLLLFIEMLIMLVHLTCIHGVIIQYLACQRMLAKQK